MLIQPLFVCAQDLQTVTDSGNSTNNLLRLTGVGKVPVTGKGLELYTYGPDNQGIIQVYDRDLNLPMRLVLQPNASSVTSIHPAGGRLLVNGAADDPGAALVVNGLSTFSSTLGPVKRGVSIFSDELNSGRTVLCMDANGGDCVGMDYFFVEHLSGVNGTRFSNAATVPLIFATNATDRMIIDGNGNVGIGTLSPGSRLSVNGTVHATKMRVTQSLWPDFVFHASYHLPSLHELEQFIRKNKHLPDMPTEAEVKQNGVDLGDTQAKLLQKIEELTLYIIDLNKKVEQQQAQIKSLQEERL